MTRFIEDFPACRRLRPKPPARAPPTGRRASEMTWVIRQGTRCRRLNHHGRIKLDHKVSGAITADRPGST